MGYVTVRNSVDGAITNIEVLGNTYQNSTTLSDIRSTGISNGDGTYKYTLYSNNENLIIKSNCTINTGLNTTTGVTTTDTTSYVSDYVRIVPNTQYTKVTSGAYCFYDYNKVFISGSTGTSFTPPTNARYVRCVIANDSLSTARLIKGSTLPTTYVGGLFNKYEVNLPCQLEKIGTVSDRLYYDTTEKAWCIEKNIKTSSLVDSNVYWVESVQQAYTYRMIAKSISDVIPNTLVLSDKLLGIEWKDKPWTTSGDSIAVVDVSSDLYVYLTGVTSVTEFKNKISSLKPNIKYITNKPQKIVLPLSTQIRLNSYLGTTNIYLDCGEILGFLRARVPKSLGSSVTSLLVRSDKIDNRLKDVETLKEGQNISYSSETGSVIANSTVNGQIDNLNLKGKTLVNLANISNVTYTLTKPATDLNLNAPIFPSIRYRLSLNCISSSATYVLGLIVIITYSDSTPTDYLSFTNGGATIGHMYLDFTPKSTVSRIVINLHNSNTVGDTISFNNVILSKYDDLQYVQGYFRGIESVGTGLDKIEVLSCGKNYFSSELEKGDITFSNGINSDTSLDTRIRTKDFIIVNYSTQYVINKKITSCNVYFYDINKTFISALYLGSLVQTFTTPSNCKYIKIMVVDTDLTYKYQLERGIAPTTYENYKYHKKQILYYGTDGKINTLSVLRGINSSIYDEIVERNGKHYYNLNCGKVTYNGTETTWVLNDSTYTSVLWFAIPRSLSVANSKVICDKFNNVSAKGDYEGIFIDSTNVYIGILKTKCTDLATFKTWLVSNNTTAVFELATKLVYECVNLDLDSYVNETSVIVNSGAISPKMTFDITSHIGNTFQVLKERISNLEDRATTLLKLVLAGNMQSLAYSLYPEDFANYEEE